VKKLLYFLLFTVALMLMACGGGDEHYADDPGAAEGYEEEYLPEPQDGILSFEPVIPLNIAADLFAQVHAIWDADDGDLWGVPLHAPLIIGCPITRHAVLSEPVNHPDFVRQGDVYVGIMPHPPQGVLLGSTADSFDGRRWGILGWDGHVQQNHDLAVQILIHEAFHAIQFGRIGIGGLSYFANWNFMNLSAQGRTALLMEAKALEAAVLSEGEERDKAIRDALSIRAHRRNLLPGAANAENEREIFEGTALFTEILAFGDARTLLATHLPRFFGWADTAFLSGGFGYYSGAMYAILLTEAGASWQQNLTLQTDLGALLQQALGVELLPIEQVDLERFGYSDLAPAQQAWVDEFAVLQKRAEEFYFGPKMLIRGESVLEDPFAPHSFLHVNIPDDSPTGRWWMVFYGDFAHIGDNWRLEINGGFSTHILRSREPGGGVQVKLYDHIQISEDGMTATTPTWTLEITNPAYYIWINNWGHIHIRER